MTAAFLFLSSYRWFWYRLPHNVKLSSVGFALKLRILQFLMSHFSCEKSLFQTSPACHPCRAHLHIPKSHVPLEFLCICKCWSICYCCWVTNGFGVTPLFPTVLDLPIMLTRSECCPLFWTLNVHWRASFPSILMTLLNILQQSLCLSFKPSLKFPAIIPKLQFWQCLYPLPFLT